MLGRDRAHEPDRDAVRIFDDGVARAPEGIPRRLQSLVTSGGQLGIQAIDHNVITNAGTITTGDSGAAITVGDSNTVTNSGAITAPSGQVALIAGIGVSYDYNASSFTPGNGAIPQGTNDNATTNLRFANYGKLVDANGNDTGRRPRCARFASNDGNTASTIGTPLSVLAQDPSCSRSTSPAARLRSRRSSTAVGFRLKQSSPRLVHDT